MVSRPSRRATRGVTRILAAALLIAACSRRSAPSLKAPPGYTVRLVNGVALQGLPKDVQKIDTGLEPCPCDSNTVVPEGIRTIVVIWHKSPCALVPAVSVKEARDSHLRISVDPGPTVIRNCNSVLIPWGVIIDADKPLGGWTVDLHVRYGV